MAMMAPQLAASEVSLSALLREWAQIRPAEERFISGISLDSRQAQPGDLFLAYAGTRTSGARYIDEALRRGAVAVAVDAIAAEARTQAGAPIIPIPGLAMRAGVIAGRFFGEPTSRLTVIGVTGTNGKSSVSHYIATALHQLHPGSAGLIGSLGYGPVGRLEPAELTTPDPIMLQRQFARMLALGIRAVAMEVSSHALQQGRVAGVNFQTAIFTNLSRDHLDFHGDMATYGEAKRRLFRQPGLRHAVINLDDAFGRELHAQVAGSLKVIGFKVLTNGPLAADDKNSVMARIEESGIDSLLLHVRSPWGEGRLQCTLTGRFNASNIVAALAALCLHGIPFDAAVTALRQAAPVPGRMECFSAPGRPTVVVDYAHTPDALAQALSALRPHCAGRLVCVFGCGGDRDRGKRPEMGAVAETLADQVVVTSDNPRSEPPMQIIDEITAGMRRRIPVRVESDRRAAIRSAVCGAKPGDVVLVAGKGHETFQEIHGRRFPFSDRQVVQDLLREGA